MGATPGRPWEHERQDRGRHHGGHDHHEHDHSVCGGPDKAHREAGRRHYEPHLASRDHAHADRDHPAPAHASSPDAAAHDLGHDGYGGEREPGYE
jgi:hypothetical protein